MKVRYLLDLHLEFVGLQGNEIQKLISKIPSGMDEVCILSGDVGDPYLPSYDIFMKFISDNFKKTFVITGNHEYYNKTKTIDEINDYLREYYQQFDNITFLHNSYEIYENYCFIGTTLWTKIENYDPDYGINDVRCIRNHDNIQCNNLNAESVIFLENILQQENINNCIIMTHHLPSKSLISSKFNTRQYLPYHQWYYCDMDYLIEMHKDKIKCWIYGHTHQPAGMMLHDVPFLCNPIGYPGENNNPNYQKIVHIVHHHKITHIA